MGIKDYLKYIDQDFPEKKSREYDYVYFDCNYMIHYLIYKCKNDNNLYIKLDNYINYLFETIKIKQELYLIFDGEYDNTYYNNPKIETHLKREKYKKKSDDYDKQSIYPKSNIIKTFKNFLEDILNKYKKIYKLNFKICLNDDQINGEADLKILNLIYKFDQNNICILSKDSDMILISYSLILNKNINIDILSNLRPIMFINVNNLVEDFKNINKINNNNYDYILIVLLLGNDYLPKISNVNYKIILENYKKFILNNDFIIKDNNLIYENLITFISYLIINNTNGKKIKFNFKNLDLNRFKIYYNNICWCLKYYKVLNNNNNYIQDEIKEINNVINIYNFINYY